MRIKKVLMAFILILPSLTYGAIIDTVMVKSTSMNKEVQVLIITPDAAIGTNARSCPVLYLLHGYGGNALSWIRLKPDLPEIADEKGVFIVCPDAKNSWYWDSPVDPSYRYETFVAKELVGDVDRRYNTISSRSGRAITGLSMGGHGGLWLSIRHKDVFGAGGSMSGGLDIRPFPEKWEMSKLLGEQELNREIWNNHTVINQLDKIKNHELALIIDCGVGDFFLQVNKDLHEAFIQRKIDHDFILRPGVHNHAYWNNAIDYQILFFRKYFSKE